MTHFTLYERAFHPDKKFGSGGFWFEGDDRDFLFSMINVPQVACIHPPRYLWKRESSTAQR